MQLRANRGTRLAGWLGCSFLCPRTVRPGLTGLGNKAGASRSWFSVNVSMFSNTEILAAGCARRSAGKPFAASELVPAPPLPLPFHPLSLPIVFNPPFLTLPRGQKQSLSQKPVIDK